MICPRCGKENPDGNEFCFYCGAKLKVESSDMDDTDTFEIIKNKEKSVKNQAMQIRKKLQQEKLMQKEII